MRTIKTLINIKYTTVFFFIHTLLSFVSRKAFLDTIGTDYLGFISLVQNLLGYLNLTELGLGVAISYALYKPLHDNDHESINNILTFYAYLMKIIGAFIFVVGTGISFFMPALSKGQIDPLSSIIFFWAYVVYTMISYYASYTFIIIQSDQKGYILTKIQGMVKICKIIVLIGLLYATRSFIIWFVVGIAFDIVSILLCNRKISTLYPWLAVNKMISLKTSFKEHKEAFRNISTTFLYKIGNVVVNQTDSLLIAFFSNLTLLGMVVNYTMITNIISNFLTNTVWNAKSSVGNLVVEKDTEKAYTVWRELFAVSFFIASISVFCLYMLTDTFILLWIGKDMLLEPIFLIALVSNVFFKITREPTEVFKTSYGLFKGDKLNTIAEFTGNFVVSILLGILIGPAGVILGTSVSFIATSFWTRPKLLFGQGFHKPLTDYMVLYAKYFIMSGVGFILSYMIVQRAIATLHFSYKWAYFIFASIVMFAITCSVFFLFFITDKYFRYFLKRIQGIYYNKK